MKSFDLRASLVAIFLLGVAPIAQANTILKATMKEIQNNFTKVAQFINSPEAPNATADQATDLVIQGRSMHFHLSTVLERAEGEMLPDKIAILTGEERDAKMAQFRDLMQQTIQETNQLNQALLLSSQTQTPRDYVPSKQIIPRIGGLMTRAHQLFK